MAMMLDFHDTHEQGARPVESRWASDCCQELSDRNIRCILPFRPNRKWSTIATYGFRVSARSSLLPSLIVLHGTNRYSHDLLPRFVTAAEPQGEGLRFRKNVQNVKTSCMV
jgi:hypothetical protein